MARPKPLKDADLLKIIAIALGRGHVLPSRHFRERMEERGFRMTGAIAVLEGTKRIRPRWNKKVRAWNYDIRGTDIEGRRLTVRIAPTEDLVGIILVTGF